MNELEPEHTAIILHWTGDSVEPDKTFVLAGIHQGEPLHRIIDSLLEEHISLKQRQQLQTEITLYWHFGNGAWHSQEYLSTYAS